MTDRLGSRADVAARLSLSEKQITNLVKTGRLADGTEFPSRVEGRGRTFPLDRCFDWYVRFKQEEALGRAAPAKPPDFMRQAALRQAIADADTAELRLATLRREVAPVDEHRRELRRILTRIRTAIDGMPGAQAQRMIGLPDMAAATTALRAVSLQLLLELQSAARQAMDEIEREPVPGVEVAAP